MKKVLLTIGSIFLILITLILISFSQTGFFRKIDNQFDGKVIKSIPLMGAEDMTISYSNQFMLISSDDRAARRNGKPTHGGLYFMNLKDPNFKIKNISGTFQGQFNPHGIDMIRLDSNHFKVFVINHVDDSHSIEVFDLYGDSLVFEKTLKHPAIKSPNDIVALSPDQFYFTNDHGYTSGFWKFMEDNLGLRAANVIYFDGKEYKEVAHGIAYANGINFDEKRNLLFVASPRDFLIKVYHRTENGTLNFIENIDCGTGVDNIELDQSGKIWIGCHPNLFGFATYAKGGKDKAPSEIICIDYKNKGDYKQERVYLNDGSDISASSVAAVFEKYIFVGNVMDDHFLVLERN